MGNHTHRILNTTNAHAPAGYELVAFVFDLLFNVVVLGATKTFGSVSQKYSLMQRYYFSLKHPNISLFYFPIGNSPYYINTILWPSVLQPLRDASVNYPRGTDGV